MYVFAQSLIKDSDKSKDMLQDVWLSLWERRQAVNNENIKAYLMQAVKFRVYKELRDGKLLTEQETYLANLPHEHASDAILEQKELEETIDRWVEKLPPKRKEVFRLSRYDDLSNKEIAAKLNISQRTVETHISHALKFLREKLGPLAFVLIFLK
jgi:RNA polymerase sigma-70 factor (ECF subfamily)